MDEYYFRHHPEYDFPDERRKPYQFKEFDEYPVFHAEDLRNPFQRRAHARMAETQARAEKQAPRSWRAELPSFSQDYTILTMPRPKFENWAKSRTAEEILADYDAKVDKAWDKHIAKIRGLENEEREEQKQIAVLEARIKQRREDVAAYKKAKEERASRAGKGETMDVKAKEANTQEKEANEHKEDTDSKEKENIVGAKEKPETEKEVEPKEEGAPANEKGAVDAQEKKAVETKENDSVEAKENESAEAKENESVEAKEKRSAETKEDAQQAKDQGEQTAEVDAEEKEAAETAKSNSEAIVLESPRLQEMKEASMTAAKEREAKFKELYSTKFERHDDVLPAHKRMDPVLRRELVQQMRIAQMKSSLTDFNHAPALIIPQQLDTRRLREFAAACDDALYVLRNEGDFIRKPIDLQFRIKHVENYKAQALDLLGRKYEVARPMNYKPIPKLRKPVEAMETAQKKEKQQENVELTMFSKMMLGVMNLQEITDQFALEGILPARFFFFLLSSFSSTLRFFSLSSLILSYYYLIFI